MQKDQGFYPGSAEYPAGTDPKFIKEYEAVKAQNYGWDPAWQSKIIGKSQRTTDPHHAAKSDEIAEAAAKNSAVSRVLLNRSYNTSYSKKGVSKERDDVTVIYKDGHVDHYECVSACQTVRGQQTKLANNRVKAGSKGDDFAIPHPSKDVNSKPGGSNGYKDASPKPSTGVRNSGGGFSKW
jgi:hypothetical protein